MSEMLLAVAVILFYDISLVTRVAVARWLDWLDAPHR